MRKICIIPARGGSKRIPRKNIKPFLGKPVIAYTINAAISTGLFDEVMVSTDDLEIAQISKDLGASVPFLRSENTANDYATTVEVLIEVLEVYKNIGQEFDFVCCIYPVAPLISEKKLIEGFEKISQNNVDQVIPICTFEYPIWRSFYKNTNGEIAYNWPEHQKSRSQDLKIAYHDIGQWYWFKESIINSEYKFSDLTTIGLEVPMIEVQDVDNEEDWLLAEMKYKFLNQKK